MNFFLSLVHRALAPLVPPRRAHWQITAVLLPIQGCVGVVHCYHAQEVGGLRRRYLSRPESLGGWRQYKVGDVISSDYDAARGEHFSGGSYFDKVIALPLALSKLKN